MVSIRALALPAAMGFAFLLLSACVTETRSDIPATATLTTSGNDRLTFTPQTDGTVWIVSVPDNHIIYSGPIAGYQPVVVDPTAHVVTVNGRIVNDKGVSTGVAHRVYFMPGPLTATPVHTPATY